ncbi:MAG: DUF892 family protein [Candidatus Zixiibacteriota bacterium]
MPIVKFYPLIDPGIQLLPGQSAIQNITVGDYSCIRKTSTTSDAMEKCNMKLNHLFDVLWLQLADLYSVERQLARTLPHMIESAQSLLLKGAMHIQVHETEEQIRRLEQVGYLIGSPLAEETCSAMTQLIENEMEIADSDGNRAAIDAGLIAAAQRIVHYEIAAYGTAVACAQLICEGEVSDLLSKALGEKKSADRMLNRIAILSVNPQAAEQAHAFAAPAAK